MFTGPFNQPPYAKNVQSCALALGCVACADCLPSRLNPSPGLREKDLLGGFPNRGYRLASVWLKPFIFQSILFLDCCCYWVGSLDFNCLEIKGFLNSSHNKLNFCRGVNSNQALNPLAGPFSGECYVQSNSVYGAAIVASSGVACPRRGANHENRCLLFKGPLPKVLG